MIELLADRVAIIPLEDPDKIGSIIVPETAKKMSDQGVIKYRGPDTKDLRVGDHVLFPAYAGSKIVIQGEGLLYVMKEEDILAVLGEGEELFTLDQIFQRIEKVFNRHPYQDVADYVDQLKDDFGFAAIREMEN